MLLIRPGAVAAPTFTLKLMTPDWPGATCASVAENVVPAAVYCDVRVFGAEPLVPPVSLSAVAPVTLQRPEPAT